MKVVDVNGRVFSVGYTDEENAMPHKDFVSDVCCCIAREMHCGHSDWPEMIPIAGDIPRVIQVLVG